MGVRSLWRIAAGIVLACCALARPGLADLEFPVCTNSPANQWMPAASGTRVVWADSRNGNWDIYLYDLATGEEQPICTAPGDQMWPEIDGDHIVWMDHRDSQWAVYMYDLTTGSERKLSDAPISATYDVWTTQGPDISGNYVVWSDSRNGNLDVFLYDLSTDTLQQITDGPADHGLQGPRVQGHRIVYRDSRNDPDGDIYLYDISTNQETVIADGPSDQGQPDIWGDIVVWREAGATSFDIYYRDLNGGTAQPLVTTPDIEDHPRVDSRYVVWSSHEMNADNTVKWEKVSALDLKTMDAVPLTVNSPYFGDLGPAISDSGMVVFEDFRNGTRDPQTNADIYGYFLTRFKDVPLTSWAHDAADACAAAGIVSGYSDGTYKPSPPPTRDQMAVYISRALAGGDGGVPTGPATATFSDMATNYWAFKYVQYAVSKGVVKGYSDGTYKPTDQVDRGQMSVFIARAIATPADGADLVNYTPPATATFPDVPANFWSFAFVEYIAQDSIGVTKGYPDGYYHPEYICTRDQMAVYVARAFELQ